MRQMSFRKRFIILSLVGILLILGACKSTSTTTTTTTSTTESNTTTTTTQTQTVPTEQSVTITLIAQNFSFDKNTISAPASANVTIHFINKDSVQHNFAAYETSAVQKSIFVGQIITGPTATIDYKFIAPSTPGTYFFRCDIHPSMMNGSFIVTAP